MQKRKNFIPRNEGFLCEQCGTTVPPAPETFRNHCPHCFTSKHVDEVPGDRAAACGGLMPTVNIEGTTPEHLDLLQQCMRCCKQQRNRTAPDDDTSLLLQQLSDGVFIPQIPGESPNPNKRNIIDPHWGEAAKNRQQFRLWSDVGYWLFFLPTLLPLYV